MLIAAQNISVICAAHDYDMTHIPVYTIGLLSFYILLVMNVIDCKQGQQEVFNAWLDTSPDS